MNSTENMGGFLIESSVEFWPEKKMLIRQSDREVIALQAPACACLLELIRNQPLVVSQAELISAGWMGREEHVLPNTFYQTMLTLRQAIRESGLDKNLILTIRGRGTCLPKNISISPLDFEQSKQTCELPVDDTPVANRLSDGLYKIRDSDGDNKHIFISIFFLVFLSLLVASYYFHISQEKYFSMYVKESLVEGCHVYVKKSVILPDFYLDFIKKAGLKCDHRSWWYISSEINSPRISLVRCTKDLLVSKSNACTTDFYFGTTSDD